MSNFIHLQYDHDGPVVTLTMNRPDVFNALSPELEAELHEALDRADQDPAARVIILTGAGKAFCAGYDLSGRGGQEVGPLDPAGRSHADYLAWFNRADSTTIDHLMHVWRLTKPVIAAVNGYAMGAGFWYQLACDITIASDRAVFAQPEVRHVSNSTFLFAALCGWKSANRFTLTGDHFDAAEALRIGLVNEVVAHEELMASARALAERIALVPEASVRLNKAITMKGLQAAGLHSGMLLNGALSVIAHASHGPDRERLFAAQRERGMRGYLRERDGPFWPEPFGPRSRPSPTSGTSASATVTTGPQTQPLSGAHMPDHHASGRPVVDEHPRKVRVADVAPTDHDPAEGWLGMAVQWVITRASGGSQNSVFGITTFPPGGRHDIHRHAHAEEIEYLVEGEGLARVGDVDVRMALGDVVVVRTDEAHGFWNTSQTDRAVLLWFYAGAANLEEAGYQYEPDVAHGD